MIQRAKKILSDFVNYVVVTYLGEKCPDWVKALFVGAGLVAVLSGLRLLLCRPAIKALEKENKKLKAENELVGGQVELFFIGYLSILSSKELKFGNTDERATIYIHQYDEESKRGYFIPCGRFSKSPTYEDKGRSQYPEDQGCIGKGWKEDWCFENDLFKSGSENYKIDKLKEYNMDQKTVEELIKRMPSQLYAVKRISNERGVNKLGVLVVESTNKNKFKEKAIKSILKRHEGYIATLIELFRPHIPNLANAALAEAEKDSED